MRPVAKGARYRFLRGYLRGLECTVTGPANDGEWAIEVPDEVRLVVTDADLTGPMFQRLADVRRRDDGRDAVSPVAKGARYLVLTGPLRGQIGTLDAETANGWPLNVEGKWFYHLAATLEGPGFKRLADVPALFR